MDAGGPLHRGWPAHRHRGPSPQPGLPLLPKPPAERPWWLRLLVDAMVVPFAQGFMLTLGIHWVRYWRRAGGLVGLFRSRAISPHGPGQ
ncbi:hypothetical protein H4R18_001761 [Coemansia javaensis]|uniref:Uncharacterized protein n=1 Tax=Coemansia javaensis TaxID=2761396 RepID=A0A9W8HCR7_9FUNG|nr:hypothetical protein H4R18_001761 [Coemansia javaensis]